MTARPTECRSRSAAFGRHLAFVATALLLVAILATDPHGSARASHAGGMDAMSIDMDPGASPGNTATSLGSREFCARIDENDLTDADEDSPDSLSIDVTATNIPAAYGMMTFHFVLDYDEGNLTVQDANHVFLLIVNPESTLLNAGDETPDTNMDNKWKALAADIGVSEPETGSGVLSRLQMSSDPGATVGLHSLNLHPESSPGAGDGAVHLDGMNVPHVPDALNNAVVAVGTPCVSPTDYDGDGVGNADEAGCGGDSLNEGIRPERIDGTFAGVDDDGDTAVDEPLPAGAASFDCDGDGYKGSAEAGSPLCDGLNSDTNVYTVYPGPQVADDAVADDGCPEGPAQAGVYSEASFKIGGSDQDPCGMTSWPSDFVSGGIPISTNRVTITDLTSFLAPARRLDTSPGHPNFSSRWDLVPGRGLFANWIAINDLTSLIAGSSGNPPMLGGAKAFGGPPCPWAP